MLTPAVQTEREITEINQEGDTMVLTVERIRQARERISPYIVQTPMLRMKSLDRYLGCQVYVKAECMQTEVIK